MVLMLPLGLVEGTMHTRAHTHARAHTHTHTHSLWCFMLPLVLVEGLRWRMVPLVAIVCWALFVIKEVGSVIEVMYIYVYIYIYIYIYI